MGERVAQKMNESKVEEKRPVAYGWIRSRCGRGVAPWMSYCNCNINTMKITCNTEI